MAHQLTKKIGICSPRKNYSRQSNLPKTLSIQKHQDSTPPISKLCASPVLAPTSLEKALVRHRRPIPLGELLVDLGLLTADRVQSALEQQKKLNHHKQLGAVLLEKGYIDEGCANSGSLRTVSGRRLRETQASEVSCFGGGRPLKPTGS